MNLIQHKTFDEERAFYGMDGITLKDCRFDGAADGESAVKECRHVTAEHCFFNLRYPFWHDVDLTIQNSEMTELCRAAVWYSENITVKDTKFHGIKALRECRNVCLSGCDIVSPEFGWSVHGITMTDSSAQSEYFMLRSENLRFQNVNLEGKYSFQYTENGTFENCRFHTKDAFWHARNVVIKNSVISGEYLAWYCENVTFDHCHIIGTQPFCYCKNLHLIDCTMEHCDLAFEKSQVEATILSHVDSIKNPAAGTIRVNSVGKQIFDDPAAKGKVILNL